MTTTRLLFIGAIFLASAHAHSVSKCSSLFTALNYGRSGLNFAHLRGKYIDTMRVRTRVAGLSSTNGLMTQSIYRFNDFKASTTLTSFQSDPGRSGQDSSFRDFAKENIDFVISNYERRRKWSPELRDHLRDEALRYAEQSAYVEYRMRDGTTGPHSGPLRGTIKFIRVDGVQGEKELPMERDFQLQIPSNGGRKFEIGNFAILKEFLEPARIEIYAQLILHARDEILRSTHEPGKMLYFTPVDSIGKLMYSRMGFELVPGLEAPREEAKTDWWMMGATAETLASLPERIAQNRMQLPAEEVAHMKALAARFQMLTGARVNQEIFRTKNISDISKFPEKDAEVRLSEPFTEDGKNYRALEFYAGPGDPVGMDLKIPLKAFPLSEGWTYQEGTTARMAYRNGKLIVRYKENYAKVEEEYQVSFTAVLTVDPEFRNLTAIKVLSKRWQFSGEF